jgi:AcrR family transcriptional regulator
MLTDRAQNQDTRETLLQSADRLFLLHGFDGVSVRQITTASGANVAAVNYHFHDKIGLFSEVLARHLDRITANKLAILQQLDERSQTTPEDAVRTYVGSFFEGHLAAVDSDRLMQIIDREMGPDSVTGGLVAQRLFIPINRAFRHSLMRVCPQLDQERASLCVSSITGQVLHFIRSREILLKVNDYQDDRAFIDKVIEHITRFSLNGIRSEDHA